MKYALPIVVALVGVILVAWLYQARTSILSAPASALDFCEVDDAGAVTDALGRHVAIPKSVDRIISLAPAITEMVFAIGNGKKLVGVTRFCDFPDEAKQIEKVGGFTDPSVETIIKKEPDLVLATADTVRSDAVEAVTRAGIPVFVVFPKSLDGVADTLECVAKIVGYDAMKSPLSVAAELRGARASAEGRVGRRPARLVVVLLSAQPLIAAGPGTFIDELLRFAGGRNVFANSAVSWPHISEESLIKTDPEFIFTTFPEGRARMREKFSTLSAVKNDRVVELDANWVERPGPRLLLGLRAIADVLHPEEVAR